MQTRLLSLTLATVLSLGLYASPASAGVVEWNNATFDIELLSFTGNQYTFGLIADFTDFAEVDQEGHYAYLVGINFRPSQGNVVDSSSESTTALGTWFYNVDSDLSGNNTNCAEASGDTNLFCAANTGDWELNPTAGNAIYAWTFTLAINGVIAGQEASLDNNASFRPLFTDGKPNYLKSITWETTSQVPEPTTLSLLGLGLAAGAFKKLRRNRK